jgi:type I restriction-modification system DNA methylase subunit
MIEGDVVDCMIALPGQLFYSTQIPACLWFLARNKNPGGKWRDRPLSASSEPEECAQSKSGVDALRHFALLLGLAKELG